MSVLTGSVAAAVAAAAVLMSPAMMSENASLRR